ncbi:hypothetical protein T4E_11484 [Trichinella pseudospiralis]|uniref:Integrase zinc-binding domain-containing protein n=1 Tax=Trichinella pseudospiralis TaxID=6337 RepID=A0A0V0YFF9_TRIPS|nr:hypothetical protein T4E_11484 [Trichinella pseudospiralis]KRY90991.1 hypothetical protein T4D_509 [Trichinella pseudospiralis]
MKSAARFYAWWPGLDRDIEFLVERCFTCLRRCQLPLKARTGVKGHCQRPFEMARHCPFAKHQNEPNVVAACSHVSVFPDTLYLTTDRNSSLTNLNNFAVTTSYHSRTNGFPEKAIRTFKERMSKAGHERPKRSTIPCACPYDYYLNNPDLI